MRIIAGTARRVGLVAPKGLDTRPTADMAKENLFNIIAADIRGARFLDLFCGSGAIGLEALSRGAEAAVLVDSAKPAIAATKQNLEKSRLTQQAEVLEMPVTKAIDTLDMGKRVFDIIFLDPPYDTALLSQTLAQLAATGLLSETGVIIAETDAKLYEKANEMNQANVPKALVLTDMRVYGRTCFLFYRRQTP